MENMKFEQSDDNKKEQESGHEAKGFFEREDIIRDIDNIFSNMPNRASAEKVIADKYSEELGDMDESDIFDQWMAALKDRLSQPQEEEAEE